MNQLENRIPSVAAPAQMNQLENRIPAVAAPARIMSAHTADRLLIGRYTRVPIMLALLLLIFWLTISGANYPSQALSELLFSLETPLWEALRWARIPEICGQVLIEGVYRVLAWVVAVVLPPMVIFFPLFSLLEASGGLHRVAYNLDGCYRRCGTCGKQALTACMGFGCNAVGVMGARVIAAPRERLIAILTNAFSLCNGRWPALIVLISIFCVTGAGGPGATLLTAVLLCGLMLLGVLMSLLISKILSATLLPGIPAQMSAELPPLVWPRLGPKWLYSVAKNILAVLGRAVVVAAPAGLVIWVMANVSVGELTLLGHLAGFLDPFARRLGLDGIILMAFILGLPANEIVLPLIIMAYLSQGALLELSDLSALRTLLVDNGWTWVTAVCTMLFSLLHWPCSTTLITIKKETGSLKWTALAFIIPTLVGMIVCFCFAGVAGLLAR